MTTTETPRVWIGCLACYNAGRLVGHWYDATEAADVTSNDAHEGVTVHVLDGFAPHEELWVMDHEGFHGLLTGECSPTEAQATAEELASVDDPAAYAAYWSNVGGDRDVATFEDAYSGEWDTFEDYAEELAESIGLLAGMADDLRGYFALDRWARDLLLGGDYFTVDNPDGGVWVFSGH